MNHGRARSHEQSRKLVCAGCGSKALKCVPVSATLEDIIKVEVFAKYDCQDTYFPNGVCGSCKTNLFKAKKGDVVPTNVRDRWNSIDYDAFKPPSRSTPCSCGICKIVRFKASPLEKHPQSDVPRVPTVSNNEVKLLRAF